MVKVAIFIEYLRDGGAERIAVTLQNELFKSIDSRLVTMYDGDNPYTLYGNYISVIDNVIPSSRIKRYFMFPYVIVKFIQYIKKEKTSIVLSILGSANICNIISSIFTSTTNIISLHVEPKYKLGYLSQFFEWCMGFAVRISPKIRVIAVSNAVKEQYHQLYKVPYDKITVLYNPIDIKSIEENVKQEVNSSIMLFDENIPVIITAGRLNKVKGQDHLIRSFASLRSDCVARLLICGVGEEEEYLKNLAKNLGIEDDVIFLGWQKNPHYYMSRSTVFVLSSISEALPNVLIEAMASGCPVISADCSPGVHEIIGENNEYGFLAEPMTGIRHQFDDPLDSGEKSLLILIRKIIDDKELQQEYVRRGKERIEFFSIEQRVNEYVTYINGCIQQYNI